MFPVKPFLEFCLFCMRPSALLIKPSQDRRALYSPMFNASFNELFISFSCDMPNLTPIGAQLYFSKPVCCLSCMGENELVSFSLVCSSPMHVPYEQIVAVVQLPSASYELVFSVSYSKFNRVSHLLNDKTYLALTAEEVEHVEY